MHDRRQVITIDIRCGMSVAVGLVVERKGLEWGDLAAADHLGYGLVEARIGRVDLLVELVPGHALAARQAAKRARRDGRVGVASSSATATTTTTAAAVADVAVVEREHARETNRVVGFVVVVVVVVVVVGRQLLLVEMRSSGRGGRGGRGRDDPLDVELVAADEHARGGGYLDAVLDAHVVVESRHDVAPEAMSNDLAQQRHALGHLVQVGHLLELIEERARIAIVLAHGREQRHDALEGGVAHVALDVAQQRHDQQQHLAQRVELLAAEAQHGRRHDVDELLARLRIAVLDALEQTLEHHHRRRLRAHAVYGQHEYGREYLLDALRLMRLRHDLARTVAYGLV